MGLVILGAAVLYLLLSIGVVMCATTYAYKHGKKVKRWGWSAALVMYLIPFWDWLPTVAIHQYYCATQSGFWIYKTLDQWKKENPGVIENTASYNLNPGGFTTDWPSEYKQYNNKNLKIITNYINNRFNEITTQEDMVDFFTIVKKENILLDTKKNEQIARHIDFSTGNLARNAIGPPGPLKFWLHNGSCINGGERQAEFIKFYLTFKGAEK